MKKNFFALPITLLLALVLIFGIVPTSYAENVEVDVITDDTNVTKEETNDELITELDDLTNEKNITPYDLLEATEYADVEIEQVGDDTAFNLNPW
jgi:hypothetical protein